MTTHPVLIQGEWRSADASGTFQAANPITGELLPDKYPVSTWKDCDAALQGAYEAWQKLRELPAARLAEFLERFAQRIEQRSAELVAMARLETGYPEKPRLADVELPRTTGQLRAAAVAAREGSWAMPTIDTQAGIRSCLLSVGPVCVFGPNNFPFAFGSISGGDFAAAIAAGNPVIAKANTSHPGTTRLFAEEALAACQETHLPAGTVQLLYRLSHEDGCRLVSDSRVGASGYTGSRSAGLTLKSAADKAGKVIYLELSSVNPVLVLPGALKQRGEKLAEEFTGSCLMGTGQFCTNPGLVILLAGEETERFVSQVAGRFESAPVGVLLSSGVAASLGRGVEVLKQAGAQVLAGGKPMDGGGFRYSNTLLRVEGEQFLRRPEELQTETFGNSSLFVIARDADQAAQILDHMEGNLTGCVYSDTEGSDDPLYDRLVPRLRYHVGRLLNDKMPTGVAVSAAMNHGGPYPATGHSGFTAVGIPAALRRFGMLACYDNIRSHRLPELLKDKNPTGKTWRLIDGSWTVADVGK